MLVSELGDAYQAAPAATLVEQRTSFLHRLARRVRPRPEVLPRRMYMPVLNGYGGARVATRGGSFHWRAAHGAAGTAPPPLPAGLLALGGPPPPPGGSTSP